MPINLTPIYRKLKNALEESSLVMQDRYIGMAALILHHIPSNKLAAFIDPGPPPTGDTSGDHPNPGVSVSHSATGKAASGTGQPGAAGTRIIVIDNNPHHCINCGSLIKPGEKYITHIKIFNENGKLPRPVYEAEHVNCPGC